MKEDNNIEAIREKLKNQVPTAPEDSRVIIAEMQINAIKTMATDENPVFSQMSALEVMDVSRALTWAATPLPSINTRLETLLGNSKSNISCGMLESYIAQTFVQRHKIDNGGVTRYLEALKSVAQKNNYIEEPPKRSLMSRMV